MSYNVHVYLDYRRVIDRVIPHLPRVGDIMRFSKGQYGVVKEVTWCMDEEAQSETQRVNINAKSEGAKS